MNKATLTAIQPPHTTNIFSGQKTVEWRTFAMPEGKHYVYETKRKDGSGMVIGTMQISRNYYFYDVKQIPEWLIRQGCVSREFLKEYAKGKILYANMIYDAKLLDSPKPYTDFKKYVDYDKPIKKRNGRIAFEKPHYFGYGVKTKNVPRTAIKAPPQSYIYIEDPEKERRE